ncbi:MAG: crotonase/enoyl-CoA hydratase family protein [Deltaproteobacteria bacterium]|nr:crotonase/enoyl-CoA hydratase family protein [Deltaproteobacteria bacterium]MBW2086463.1 crotonase/enoyl-CoA hydratase family protein [Deltaproteobacteria bacterium]
MLVLTEKKGPVTTIIINRPEVRNAVDGATAKELANAFRVFEADDKAKVGVLTGAEGCFCAGADLKAITEGQDRTNRVSEEGDGPMGPTRMWLDKPVIAAVAGYAVAGGLELALWCDLRVMEKDAYFGVFCRRWGVPLMDGGTVRLPRLIGLSQALDMILTGRPVGAAEALRIGLANRIVETGASRAEAETLAEEIAQFPERCMLNDRRSAYEQMSLPFDMAMRNEFRLGLATFSSGETVEGASRFAQGAGRHGAFE